MNCLRRPSREPDYDRPSGRGLLLPLFAALGILALTAAVPKLFPGWLQRGKIKMQVSPLTTVNLRKAADPQLDQQAVPRLSGLIDPRSGDNGTDPAQITTGRCACCMKYRAASSMQSSFLGRLQQSASITRSLIIIILAFATAPKGVNSYILVPARFVPSCVALVIAGCDETADEYAGDYSFPVLNGVDLVAYFSLAAGAAPVYGTENYMAVFGNYRFYFSSVENLQEFEVWQEIYVWTPFRRTAHSFLAQPTEYNSSSRVNSSLRVVAVVCCVVPDPARAQSIEPRYDMRKIYPPIAATRARGVAL